MRGLSFFKNNFHPIMKDIQPLKRLTNKHLNKIKKLEITVYNPNSEFNRTVFRSHKYECKICYEDRIIYIEESTCKNLIKKIISVI